MSRESRLLGLTAAVAAALAVVAAVWLGRPETPIDAPSVPAAPAVSAPVSMPAAPPVAPPAAAAPPPAPRDDYDGPLAEIVLTDEQTELLHEAEEQAVKTCMNERGFEYLPAPFLTEEASEPWNDEIRAGDLEAASVLGYGVTRSLTMVDVPPPEFPNENLLAGMSAQEVAAWDSAYSGMTEDMTVPPSGPSWLSLQLPGIGEVHWDTNSCLSQARRVVYGDDRLHMEDGAIEQAVMGEAASAVKQDPEHLAAIDRWRQCMAGKGHHYQAPGEPEQALWEAFNSGKLKPNELEAREIELATAEAACYIESGMEKARKDAQARAETSIRASRTEEIGRLVSRQREALGRARELAPADEGQ